MQPSNEQKREILRQMLRIRALQLKIEAEYLKDEMKTPVHLYIGEEAIAAGVCAHLRPDDYVSSNHRSHGHYLAKGGNMQALVSELFCKQTGCSKGRGGSMHVVDVSVGHLGSSAIVGGGIPLATGMGLSIKMQGEDRVSVVFFGDGAADEGVLYESLNFALLKKLPVIYVMENNQYSVCSKVRARHATDNVFHNLPKDVLPGGIIDGNDALAVFEAASAAVARARSGEGPSFIECLTYRLRGHAGCPSQDFKGYRDAEEVRLWEEKCPVEYLKRQFTEQGIISPAEIGSLQEAIDAELEAAFSQARLDPLPKPEDLELYLYSE